MLGPCRLAIAFACLATVAIASLPSPRSAFEARRDPRLPQVRSIQAHLAEVEHHLRAHPPAGLDSARAAARSARLDDLRAYRLRGVFPRNLDFPDRVIPYFIDDNGVACAVGHLMLLSGGGALAREISRTRNHVYIPDERDPRLPEWARANGLTLEECARIQPSYEAQYHDIFDLAFDAENRLWVPTGNGVSIVGYVLSRLNPEGWAIRSRDHTVIYRDFCLVGNRPLMVHDQGLAWDGGATSHPDVARVGMGMEAGSCAAMPDGTGFWIGGKGGLWEFAVDGTGPPVLGEKVRAGAGGLPGDTVHSIAASGYRLWAATSQGVAYRNGSGAWSRALDYADMTGKNPGGLEADRAGGVWIGTLSTWVNYQDDRIAPPFSDKGLARIDSNGKVTWYHEGNSPLPGNSIRQATPARDGGIWLTTEGSRIWHFLPPDRLTPVPTVLQAPINAMETDAEGRLYVGTYAGRASTGAARGVFRLEGDSLVWMGHPAPPSSIVGKKDRNPGRGASWRDLLGPGGDGLPRLDMLGRRFRASD